ncbi:MAG: 4Fe-4S binding protein [Spirochaetaceae bacterium]|jgi:class 3 adenylate cyclase/iron only hydrogenase large subunit-like protein|nr:4Fe-4S binding protein [Spirochaetaceae bacterium]
MDNSSGVSQLIHVNRDKCNNCHHCISVCPVKACIDGSGYRIDIIHERCLGCGRCVAVCQRKARFIADDSEFFFAALESAIPIVAVVAPSAVTVFGNLYKLNGFLKSIGVIAIFDVSFGAELAAKSYLHYIAEEKPQILVAQPCAALVSFCQIYHPEIIPYLAPVHSPMLHTAVMIRRFFPEYEKAKIAAISPCAAKKREFDETGLISYNISMTSIKQYLELHILNLDTYHEMPFDGPSAERGVGFSSPGGLRATVLRDAPGIEHRIRRIEGNTEVYTYLTEIPQMLREKTTPLIVDCLSCRSGCNGGLGTGNTGMPIDRLEAKVEKRMREHIKMYQKQESGESFSALIKKYWQPGIYNRKYLNLNHLMKNYKEPNEKELSDIYKKMKKRRESDFLNCAACGYGSCKGMAEAIFNGLNRAENCHQYLSVELEVRNRLLHDSFGRYMPEEIVNSLLESGSGTALGGKLGTITIMMCDLRGFTQIAEKLTVEKVVTLLNHYFTAMVEIIQNHKGTVIEYLGDSVLSIFGAPVETQFHAEDAIACAIQMQNAMKTVNEWNVENNYPELAMGVGINTGPCIIGNIGSEKTMKYNVIGKHVNLCGRIESYTIGGEIYISEYTRNAINTKLTISNTKIVHPKGIAEPVEIYQIDGIGFPYYLRKKSTKQPFKHLKNPMKLVCYRILDKYVEKIPAVCTVLALSQLEAIISCKPPRSRQNNFPELDIMDNIQLQENAASGHVAEQFINVSAKITGKIKAYCYRISFTSDAKLLYAKAMTA